ncbi:MAG: hypothetical protein R2712_02905 [Vicinamibacterales bacterium]
MMARLFVLNGWVSTVLLAAGLAASWRPGPAWSVPLLYAGLLLLILTPVTRVLVAGVRYLRAGQHGPASLAGAILAIIALSAWLGAR